MSSTGATLSGSFTGATGTITETGFYWGLTSGNLSNELYVDSATGSSGSFTGTLGSLTPGVTFYYRAYVLEYNESTGSYEYRYGEVKSFTTSKDGDSSSNLGGYLELPAATSGSNYFSETLKVGSERNYSYLYDKSMYTALWVAYPLTASHTSGSASSSSWSYNPNIEEQYQINVLSNSYQTNYGNGDYSRGHQLPNADRKSSSAMNRQAFYLTNQTPQLQNKFNAAVWSSLETEIRALTSGTDTVYVVTGACFRKVGGNETITYLEAAKDGITPAKVPVPNYYWKVLLKVKRNGHDVAEASAIGVWLEHKDYTGNSWSDHVVSVDEIESYTGIDFFANLPDTLEATAETNTYWKTFYNF